MNAPAPVPSSRPRSGFTIIEMLIVVIVLGVLASLVIPSLASATLPIPRSLADLVEYDLRRARVESVGMVSEVNMVVGRDRDRWWLQRAGTANVAAALPSSVRVLGRGSLGGFEGLRLELRIDGATPPRGEAAVATYSPQGERDRRTIELRLLEPDTKSELGRWRIDPQRSKLNDLLVPEVGTSSGSMRSGG